MSKQLQLFIYFVGLLPKKRTLDSFVVASQMWTRDSWGQPVFPEVSLPQSRATQIAELWGVHLMEDPHT